MVTERKRYIEAFDDGPGGWVGWFAGGFGPRRLEFVNGAAMQKSPWGVDINHAPPGAAYLHLLYCLLMTEQRRTDIYGVNRFITGGYPRDLTNTKWTFRLRGEIDLKGTELLFLTQADVGPVRANHVLKAQPITVTRTWSEQTITLVPDESQWLCMGTRGPGADCPNYGQAPIADVLKDVNVDVILVLFGLDVQPFKPITGDKDRLIAGKEYRVNYARLPDGYLLLDEIRVEWPA